MPSLGGSGEYGGDDPTGGASMGSGGYASFASDYGGNAASDLALSDPLIAFSNARNQMNNPSTGNFGQGITGNLSNSNTLSLSGELGIADADMGFGSDPSGVDGITGPEMAELSDLAQNLPQFNQLPLTTQAEIAKAVTIAKSKSSTEESAKSLLEFFGNLALNTANLLTGGFLDVALDMLGLFGVNLESAKAAMTSITEGVDPSTVASSLGPGDFDGGPADPPGGAQDLGSGTGSGGTDSGTGSGTGDGTGGTNNDPLNYDFWNSFVDEWMDAKDMYLQDDAFKKSKVEPAIGRYQAALADLTNQANTGTGTYTPTTFGMGNFRSSFVPKSGHLKADDLRNYAKDELGSELALTDVMQPNKGSMDYLSALRDIAQFDRQAQLQKYGIDMGYNTAIDSIQEGNEDKGSWLDIVKDVVQIGDTVGDAWTKYF